MHEVNADFNEYVTTLNESTYAKAREMYMKVAGNNTFRDMGLKVEEPRTNLTGMFKDGFTFP
jgi:hypothetical protein